MYLYDNEKILSLSLEKVFNLLKRSNLLDILL